MTVRTNAVQTCDRCEKPFNEKHLKASDVVPTFKQRGLIVTETKGTNQDPEPKSTVLFSFDDMCPDCQKAVDNLLVKLRMDSKPKKKRAPAKKRGSKKDAPKTPEYSENPDDDPAKADAEKPDESAKTEGEEATEAKPETTEETPATEPEENSEPEAKADAEPEANAEEPAEPELANEPGETDDGGNGAEASSGDDDGLVEDPSTGDKYDPATGEVVVKGSKNGEQEKHPF